MPQPIIKAILAVGLALMVLALSLRLTDWPTPVMEPAAALVSVTKPDAAGVRAALGTLPLHFIENSGQVDERVAYYVQGHDKAIYFTAQGLTFVLNSGTDAEGETRSDIALSPASYVSQTENSPTDPQPAIHNPQPSHWALKLDFVGASAGVRPEGEAQTEAVFSYFKGHSSQWKTGVKSYSRVVYRDLWPGIDLIYAGTVNRMKYSFVVRPGADPQQIKLAYRGASEVKLNAGGELEVETPAGGFTDERPISLQHQDGQQVEIDTAYRIDPQSASHNPQSAIVYGFAIGEYDRSRELVIDPAMLVYAGYIGGSGFDSGFGIAVDGAGNAYVVGSTNSTDATFPDGDGFGALNGPDPTSNGGDEAFVAKINATGTALVYASFIGGSGADSGFAIAVDGAGNAYVAGTTSSAQATFPDGDGLGTLTGPDTTYNGNFDGFVVKINAAGTALVYAGYIGGNGVDNIFGIAVDSAGSAYVMGQTSSTQATFPDGDGFGTLTGTDTTYNGGFNDAFVAKINPAGTALVYVGYIGGSGDDIGFGIELDSAGNAYVTGSTDSPQASFPDGDGFGTVVGPDTTFNGGVTDVFVAKVDPTGTTLRYAGYIGGAAADVGNGIAVDSAGNAYVAGRTSSADTTFPDGDGFGAVTGPDITYNGGSEAFVAKINVAGTALTYASYIGGSGLEVGGSVAVDGAGNAYVTGETNSPAASFPDGDGFGTLVGPDTTFNGGLNDAFVVKLNAAGTSLVYAGYIGGSGFDIGEDIAVDSSSNAVYIVGRSASTEATFPDGDGFGALVGPDTTYNGSSETFVAKIAESTPTPTPTPTPSPSPAPSPATIQFSQSNFAVSESAGFVNVNVTRSGDTGTAVSVDYTTSDNSDVIPDEAQAVALCGAVNSVALSKCDFNTALGTLRFASGESTKSFTVLLTQDSYVEGTEFAPLTLSNPTNGAVLGNQSTAMLQITDDVSEPSTNAIDDARNFVRQHYHDFLNREPDQAGWDFWTDNIAKCNDPARRPPGQTAAQCIDKQRETTSGAFFLSPEFQYTGSYIYAVYKGSLNRRPTFLEFMRDLPQLVNGIIVGGAISGPVIEANRAQYLAQFIQRSEFANIYGALNNQGYVDKLFLTTGTSVSSADRQALVTGLNGGTETRSSVLHKVVNGTRVIAEGQVEIIADYGKSFSDTQFNAAFVQMEYFGYMRRNEDQAGFDFWLGKLNFYGDFITAEMVRSFLLSPEYRRRFGST